MSIVKSKTIKALFLKKNPLLVKKFASFFFIVGIIVSNKLWIIYRNFPVVPLFDSFLNITTTFSYVLFFILLILLTLVLLFKNRIFLFFLFALLFYLLLQDQMRWQPWVYIYMLVLFPFLFKSDKKDDEFAINYLQILFIGIYIWSGIHKLNPNFNELIVESFVIYVFKITNISLISFIKNIGFMFPVVEILGGLFLIFPRTRRIGVYITISIHLFILLYISPFGMNYNYIILPWNLFMIIGVLLLFNRSTKRISVMKKKTVPSFLNLTVLLVMLVPLLNFFNLWDSYLSFSLYSGKIDNYYILIKDNTKLEENTFEYSHYFESKKGMSGGEIINIDKWSMNELNVPMVPEKRIFKKIAQKFCSHEEDNSALIFLNTKLPIWKLRHFDAHKKTTQKSENYINKMFFLEFEKPFINYPFVSFTCKD